VTNLSKRLGVDRDEADKVAARRAAASRKEAAQQVGEGSSARHAEILTLSKRAKELIPQALDALSARDFEGIEEIEVYMPREGIRRMVGSERLTKVGAYCVSPFSF
jgi:hypothetical protein